MIRFVMECAVVALAFSAGPVYGVGAVILFAIGHAAQTIMAHQEYLADRSRSHAPDLDAFEVGERATERLRATAPIQTPVPPTPPVSPSPPPEAPPRRPPPIQTIIGWAFFAGIALAAISNTLDACR